METLAWLSAAVMLAGCRPTHARSGRAPATITRDAVPIRDTTTIASSGTSADADPLSDGSTARASIDASTVVQARGVSPPAAVTTWLTRCHSAADPWAGRRMELFDDALAQDQRAQQGPADHRHIATHLGVVYDARDRPAGYLVAGFLIAGDEDDDQLCSRLIYFETRGAGPFYHGLVGLVGGPPIDAVATLLRVDGPYNGAALLVLADGSGRLLHVRYIDGPTLARPDAIELFPGGRSFRVFTLADGMNTGGMATADLVALTTQGLRIVHSATLGAFEVVAVGAAPRIRVAGRRGRPATELVFDTAAAQFIPAPIDAGGTAPP